MFVKICTTVIEETQLQKLKITNLLDGYNNNITFVDSMC